MSFTTPDTAPLTADEIARFGENPLVTFRDNLGRVEERIVQACQRAGRRRNTVRLLPITKTVPANVLRYAYTAGMHSFGENKIQEGLHKQSSLEDLAIEWSIVGHLQSNKVKFLTRIAREFHSLDSFNIADLINTRLLHEQRFLDVYIQVNTSDEKSKFGFSPNKLLPFIESLENFPQLRPRGLMTLALFSSDMRKVRQCFRQLRDLRDDAVKINSGITELCMGMSGDFEVAIEEGANVVRVGRALFGERQKVNDFERSVLAGGH
ncbi:YggS family pyridoxal phosphate-dependent enzyme [Ochrobactrum vermis]|uniref:Pyridoxal phosphate homeostasis protein n=1 Tax=Ochrobactrum vermis TaxID=1827297 RepID=A0ABU8PMW8_9HYPH|nr:YggS family pyridoxal phosphate-dependent enzyme [Ochrobactrum vermis]PQZ24371.1 YggS family pyridoxal phosphate-dependent enzyme [Ochrobactrum vermis]